MWSAAIFSEQPAPSAGEMNTFKETITAFTRRGPQRSVTLRLFAVFQMISGMNKVNVDLQAKRRSLFGQPVNKLAESQCSQQGAAETTERFTFNGKFFKE